MRCSTWRAYLSFLCTHATSPTVGGQGRQTRGESTALPVIGSNRIGFFRGVERGPRRESLMWDSRKWVGARVDKSTSATLLGSVLLTHHRRHLGGGAKAQHGVPSTHPLGPGPICCTGTIPSSRKLSRKARVPVLYALSRHFLLFFKSASQIVPKTQARLLHLDS